MSQQSPFAILGKRERNMREGQIKRKRVDVVETPCMMPAKRTKKQAIVTKDKKVGAGGKRDCLVGKKQRLLGRISKEKKGLVRWWKRGEGFTRPVTALWSLWWLIGDPCYVISCWTAMQSGTACLHTLFVDLCCDWLKWMEQLCKGE